MIKYPSTFGIWLAAFCVSVALPIQAQRTAQTVRPSGVNRGAGGAGTFGGGSASGGQRQYYGSGQVGEAMVTSDPETRRLIVITDDETSQYVSQVITTLDRPKPQVLIKVVFLEVTYGKGFDIGLEGGTTRRLDGSTTLGISNLFGVTPSGETIGKGNAGL